MQASRGWPSRLHHGLARHRAGSPVFSEYLFRDPTAYDHAWSRTAVIVDGLGAKVVCNFIAAALERDERQQKPAP